MKANQKLNHSAAHLLAAAVKKIYPDVVLGFGPSIDEGFYYDFKFKEPLQDSDLKKIEKQMKKIVSGGYKYELMENESNPENEVFKQELINEIKDKGENTTYYGMINPSNGTSIFTDLCAGPHIDSTSKIKHFKLLSIAGAYWRGDSNNEQLTRIYGTAWETSEQLEKYIALIEDRKERDHRKIGKDLNIFTFNHKSIQGFPIWLEDGMALKNTIKAYIRKTEYRYGFREVSTPAFGSKELYVQSGHWAHYQDTMFPMLQVDNEELVMRPMTCPHHILIYNMKRKSFRDLPIRMSEQAQLYRYEKSGALSGLERVRSMELTEGHVFARRDQVAAEFKNAYLLIKETLEKFNIDIDYVSLSLRDPSDKEKYFDDNDMWEDAEASLRHVLDELKLEYIEMKGEAAFYGPKIDIQVKNVLGREITMSTLQLDFLLPRRFETYFINSKGEKETPVLIHRGLIGTYERFISILLEQTKGVLPFWLAPRQVTIIPVDLEKHFDEALKIQNELESYGIRVHMDSRNERLGKKIRDAQTSKTKYQIVVGDKELESNTINVRAYGSQEQNEKTLKDFILEVTK